MEHLDYAMEQQDCDTVAAITASAAIAATAAATALRTESN